MPSPRRKNHPKKTAAPVAPAVVAPTPLHEIPLKKWREHAELQRSLRALIENPVFLMATQTIIRAAFPGMEPAAKAEANVSADATNAALAARYAHRSGIAYFSKLLKFLASDSGPNTVPTNSYALMAEDE